MGAYAALSTPSPTSPPISRFVARSLKLCGTNLNLYDNVHFGLYVVSRQNSDYAQNTVGARQQCVAPKSLSRIHMRLLSCDALFVARIGPETLR